MLTAVEFGVQPDLFHTADGTPLYAPFHLAQTLPAMLLAHLLVAGVVEAALTAGVVAYLQRANPAVLRINPGNGSVPGTVAAGVGAAEGPGAPARARPGGGPWSASACWPR